MNYDFLNYIYKDYKLRKNTIEQLLSSLEGNMYMLPFNKVYGGERSDICMFKVSTFLFENDLIRLNELIKNNDEFTEHEVEMDIGKFIEAITQ